MSHFAAIGSVVARYAAPHVNAVHINAVKDSADLARRLDRLRRLAWLLNGAFRLPGIRTRFGVDTLLDLVPGGGDAVQLSLSLYIVWEAWRLGVSRSVLRRMMLNVAIEASIGLVPVAGDLFDTVFKADLRNMALIDAELRRRA